MQTVNAEAAVMLATAVRAPRLYCWVQYPLIVNDKKNTYDFSKLGSQLVLNQLTALRRINVLDTGSDTADLEIQGDVRNYSPLSSTSAYGRFFAPGVVDTKFQLFMGIAQAYGTEVIWPKGVYVTESVNMDSQNGATKFQMSCLDQFSLFRGDIYTSFPPRIYGGQSSPYYNPNYALTTSDNTNFICDGTWWMTDPNSFPAWAPDFPNTASGDGSTLTNGYAVYLSSVGGGMTPLSAGGGAGYPSFTVDTNKGIVTFSSAISSDKTVSVDCRPMAMRPELAMYHLLVDFGDWDPNFLKIDQTGSMIPLTELAREQATLDCAKNLTTLVSPHGNRWSLFIDESGYITFTDFSPEGPAVKTLLDTHDIIHTTPEFSAATIYNVVRAQGTLQNNTPIESISYDVYSISIFGQKPTYDLPSQLVNAVQGMDVGSAASYLNGLTASVLFEYSRPSVSMDIEVLPDPSLQVGDPLNIIDSDTGINSRFYIKQITDEIQGADWKQTLRVDRQPLTQNWNWGIAANLGVGETQNPNAIQVQSGFITRMSFQNHYNNDETVVIQDGQPLLDQSYQPVLFKWHGRELDFNITIGNFPKVGVGTFKAWIFRWFYIAEDAYIHQGPPLLLDGGGIYNINGGPWTPGDPNVIKDLHAFITGINTLPYDVRANNSSAIARKYWWPLLRTYEWEQNDGVTAFVAGTGPGQIPPITGTKLLSSTWSQGPGTINSFTVYGDLVIGANDFFGDRTPGFVGQQLYADGTPAAAYLGQSSNLNYGVDFGKTFNQAPVYYGIKNQQTPCYFNIFFMTNAGTFQYLKIPFLLAQEDN